METKTLILLSGPLGVGKTTLALELAKYFGFEGIKSSNYLREQCRKNGVVENRTQLQDLGDRLDIQTDYAWIIDAVASPTMASRPDVANWYFDAVRKPRQVEHFRSRFHTQVKHVHFTASEDLLIARFNARDRDEGVTYADAIKHPNEVAARSLAVLADLLIDVESSTTQEIATRIANLRD